MRKANAEAVAAAAAPAAAPTRRPGSMLPYHLVLLVLVLAAWYGLTETGIAPPLFFGRPLKVFWRIWVWFSTGSIYIHLLNTLIETLLGFVIGTILGLVVGLWLALNPFLANLFDPYIKAFNSMPRLIFAPIFAMWFGLGVWSKVALGVSLVFFIVFFNVYQGVREVSPTVLANVRMLGATRQHLLRYVYLPSATSWVFSSLHNAVGIAFVGAVVGEYLGSARGIGYLILQAEGVFDIDTVLAGILVLTGFALVLDLCVGAVEKRLLLWRPTQGETSAANASG